MIEAQTFGMACADSVGAMGAGVLLGVFYHILRFITGNARYSTPVRDILFAPIAAVLCFSYCVTYSFAGTVRWYIIFFIIVGLLCYRAAVMKKTFAVENSLRQKVRQSIIIPKKIAFAKTQHIKNILYNKYKTYNSKQKVNKNTSKKGHKVLYNSNL